MADLTGDDIARLREVASTEGPGHMYAAWRQLNAVLDEIDRLTVFRDELAEDHNNLCQELDRLRADNETWAVRWQEQYDRAETAASHPCPHVITDDEGTSYCRLAEDATRTTAQLDALTETVRDVAESLGETGSASDSLAAQTLHTACDQAGEAG